MDPYSSVDIIKNISLHGYVCAILYRNVDKELPGVMASHLNSKDTECSSSNQVWDWRSWGTHGAEGIDVDFEETLGN